MALPFKRSTLLLSICFVFLATACAEQVCSKPPRSVGGREVELRDGKLFVNGQWVFLKIGKPLINFADAENVSSLINDLGTLQAKGYNCLELNCYWHQLDPDGNGTPDGDLSPLRRLIDEINARGMFACLSVETYGVGGGQIPAPFLQKYPDALAVNSKGKSGIDTEYGFMTAVPSIFHAQYRQTVYRYIEELAARLDTGKILWFETTVEPQYMGDQNLDYSVHAKRAFQQWQRTAGVQGPAWPSKFPVSKGFRTHPVWNRFRAEALAEWVNGDAAAYRRVAGAEALVAVDYLETDGKEMPNRNGDSLTFLRHLSSADIIQVNWHWSLVTKSPNLRPYRNVRQVMCETGRPWAITEHMTLNGSDYKPGKVPAMLENTLANGTRLGWEFVNVVPKSDDSFALYNKDWSPKPLMAVVDKNWDYWLHRVAEVDRQVSCSDYRVQP